MHRRMLAKVNDEQYVTFESTLGSRTIAVGLALTRVRRIETRIKTGLRLLALARQRRFL